VPLRHELGSFVTHPSRPEWGPGRVLNVRGSKITVYFRDVPGDDPRDAVKTILMDRVELDISDLQSDTILDNLPPYRDGQFARLPRKRVTLSEGIDKFRSIFPLYFEDPRYIGDLKDGERAYKWAAHRLFADTLGGGRLRQLLDDGEIDEARRRALAVESRVNILAVFEKVALRDGLRDDRAAQAFLTALSGLIDAEAPAREPFERYAAALGALSSEEGKTDPAKWTVATVLPYLAAPERFMFLKPRVTQDCAARLTFDLKYSAQLKWVTYRKLLEMSHYLLRELRPYGARDFIDVQSFVWVIGGGWDDV